MKRIILPRQIECNELVLEVLEPTNTNIKNVQRLAKKNFLILQKWFHYTQQTCSKKHTQQLLRKNISDLKQGSTADYHIMLNGTIIGEIWADIHPHCHEICYWLDKDYQGKGYMKRTLLTMESMLSSISPLPFQLEISPLNIPSQKFAEKMGYHQISRTLFQKER